MINSPIILPRSSIKRGFEIALTPGSVASIVRRLAALVIAASLAGNVQLEPLRASEPLEPAAALADFRLPAGYRIELAAAEPEVVDPVAIAFDERRRLWVVEMRDYPTLADGAAPSSRIRILEDRDADGRYETARTFADGLLFPTGLQLWKSGAFVTLAGEVAYFPDDDNDGRADRQETWFEGFAMQNEQLRANHPTLAADGWIYVAGGLRGGQIRNRRRPQDPSLPINGRDFAFDPRTGACLAVSGNGQFGLAFDEFGRRYVCSNRNPLIEVMIEQRYLERNARLSPPVAHDAAAAGDQSKLYPRSRALTTSAQHAGQFTAACGVKIYGGGALPAAAASSAFVCEPTANLVHRETLDRRGAASVAQRAELQDEFLTATDEWFRPVNLYTGPDGALYVVDMYRAVIEHPEWMPDELRQRADLRRGDDRGRIYRIVADDVAAAGDITALPDDLPSVKKLLDSPNSWRRDLAVRWILQASDQRYNPLLESIAAESPSPVARWLALALLDAHGALSSERLRKALVDPVAGVREQALRLAEERLPDSAAISDAVVSLLRDEHPRVRFQAALSSMFLEPSRAAALVDVARRDAGDEWACRAVALAARDKAGSFLAALLANAGEAGSSPTASLIAELVEAAIAHDGVDGAAAIIETLAPAEPQTVRRVLLAIGASLRSRGASLGDALASAELRSPAAAVYRLLDASLITLADPNANEAQRLAAGELVSNDSRPGIAQPLLDLLRHESSPQMQLSVLAALRAQHSPRVAEALVERLPEMLPTVRRAAVDVLASRSAWAATLLAAVEAETIGVDLIEPAHRARLLQYKESQIHVIAERLFGGARGDRAEVVQRYQEALSLSADAERGRVVFNAACTSCHRLAEAGVAVGPDIGDSSMKTSAQLLTDILDPNRAIDANYVNYTALTADGLGHQGLVRSETVNGIVLVAADGKTITLLRDQIESLTSGQSLMPEGLEQQVSPQQMADLLMYLKTWRHLDDLREADEVPAKAAKSN